MFTKYGLKTKIYLSLLIIFYISSLLAFVYSYRHAEQERLKYADFPTTDLSSISVEGNKLGSYIDYPFNPGLIYIDCENGTRYSSYSDFTDESYLPSNAIAIFSRLSGGNGNVTVDFNGQKLSSFEECLQAIGGNYLFDDSYYETMTYFDHQNNIQLTLTKHTDGLEFVELKRIDPQIYKPTKLIFSLPTEGLFLLGVPPFIFELVDSVLIDHHLLSVFDYFLIPIIYATILLPIFYMFFSRTKTSIKLALLVILYLIWSYFFTIPMLMSI